MDSVTGANSIRYRSSGETFDCSVRREGRIDILKRCAVDEGIVMVHEDLYSGGYSASSLRQRPAGEGFDRGLRHEGRIEVVRQRAVDEGSGYSQREGIRIEVRESGAVEIHPHQLGVVELASVVFDVHVAQPAEIPSEPVDLGDIVEETGRSGDLVVLLGQHLGELGGRHRHFVCQLGVHVVGHLHFVIAVEVALLVYLVELFGLFEQDGPAFGAGVVLGGPLSDAPFSEDVCIVEHHGTFVVFADEIVDGVGDADDAGCIFLDDGGAVDGHRGEVGEELLAGDSRGGRHGS
jgi:hypothetical protein